MPSFGDAAAAARAAGAPVLFLDTCVILDVIRAPARAIMGCVEAATRLLAMASATPAECTLVVASFVPGEWASHDQSVLADLTAHFDRMQGHASHFHGLCGHLGLSAGFGLPAYAASGLAARVHALSRDVLNAAIVLDRHNDTMTRAYDRVAVTKRRPCKNGGELKDCTIFEECLEVCRLLKAGGFARRTVFCTSNINDYCDPGVTPHPEVAADCASVGLIFTTSLPWALKEVTA